jgi:hypothetical protein
MTALGKFDVIFKGDENISYGLFVKILDNAKLAGATSFSVEHENECNKASRSFEGKLERIISSKEDGSFFIAATGNGSIP